MTWRVALLTGLGLAIAVGRGRVRHVIVSGHSMAPTLRPGDRLVMVRIPGGARPGQLVLAADPRAPGRTLVKRVHAVAGGRIDLRGDAASASTDSRTFGTVPADAVHPCLALRYHPPARRGRVG